jgi:hypothetical protein
MLLKSRKTIVNRDGTGYIKFGVENPGAKSGRSGESWHRLGVAIARHERKKHDVNFCQGNQRWMLGLVGFAGFIMITIGVFHIVQGIAAIIEDDFYVLTRNYAYEVDISTWCWIHLVIGVILVLAGFYVFSGTLWARIIGIILAVMSAVANFFYVPYYPVWSILIIALDVVVIWALATYRRTPEVV